MACIANAGNATITPIDGRLQRTVPERPVLGPPSDTQDPNAPEAGAVEPARVENEPGTAYSIDRSPDIGHLAAGCKPVRNRGRGRCGTS
jgi:hypothetical protein